MKCNQLQTNVEFVSKTIANLLFHENVTPLLIPTVKKSVYFFLPKSSLPHVWVGGASDIDIITYLGVSSRIVLNSATMLITYSRCMDFDKITVRGKPSYRRIGGRTKRRLCLSGLS